VGRVPGFQGLSAVGSGWPSGLAVAPKVASAPRGPGPAPLAGNPLQSRPRATGKGEPQRIALNVLPAILEI